MLGADVLGIAPHCGGVEETEKHEAEQKTADMCIPGNITDACVDEGQTDCNQQVSEQPETGKDHDGPVAEGTENGLPRVEMTVEPVETAPGREGKAAGRPHQRGDHAGGPDKECLLPPVQGGMKEGGSGSREYPE